MGLVDPVALAVQLVALRVILPRRYRAASLDRLLGDLARLGPRRPLAVVERAVQLGERVASSLPVPDTCLYRTLARFRLLRRNGWPAEFVLAVSPLGPDHDGHAWLELDGQPFSEESNPADFVVAFRFPPRANPRPHA